MMGYEKNWVLRSFQDAIGYGYHVHTLIFLCEQHISLWSSNCDIEKILKYLESLVYKGPVNNKDNKKENE